MDSKVENADEKPMPLDGIKVVEYGIFHAGPGAGAILGDLGAEVIKIESNIGDPERYWTDIGGLDISFNGSSTFFEVTNRNKKGIYLDIKTDKGRNVFHRLIKDADIFLTNLRPTTKAKLEIDYASLSKINPKMIHANVSGYGPQGPLSDTGAYDSMGQAISGMMFTTATEFPAILRHGLLDQATAIAASQGILTALFVRERRGIGQEVHVSLYSTGIWLQHFNLMIANALSKDPCTPINRDDHSPLRNCFCCKDGRWMMSTHHPEEKYWPTLCKVAERPDLIEDPAFTDAAGAPISSSQLIAIFDNVFATKTSDEWMEIFIENGLMFCTIKQIHDVENDPQALANNYIVPFEHPIHGDINIAGYPIHFSECNAGTKSFAPEMGEHTDQVMHNLGYSEKEVQEMKTDGVIK